jgi:hypothetical protein
MKRYKVEVDVTNRYRVDVDAVDESDAMNEAERLVLEDGADAVGEFISTCWVEAQNVFQIEEND